MRRQIAATAAAITALCFAPAALAAPSAVDALQYKARIFTAAAEKRTLLDRAGLKLEVSCAHPDGTILHVTTDPGSATAISGVATFGDDDNGWDTRYTLLEGGSEADLASTGTYMTETVHVLGEKMLVIDGLAQEGALGRRNCTWSGTVRTVPPGDQIRRTFAAGDQVSFESGPTEYTSTCGASVQQLLIDSVPQPNSIAKDFNDGDELWDTSYSSYGPGLFPIANVDADSTVIDILLAQPGGILSSLRGMVDREPSGSCVIRYAERPRVSKGASRAYLSAKPARRPVAFFEQGGLKLMAQCNARRMLVRARSAVDSAVFRSRVSYEGHIPITIGNNDLDKGETATVAPLVPGSKQATGQLVYARPDGKVLSMTWGARHDEGGARPCQFAGLASNG